MYGRRMVPIVPILLTFGLVHMFLRHGPMGLHGEHGEWGPSGDREGHRAEWEKRVPPIVEKWHQRMHEAQQPSATTPPAAV